MCGNLRACGWDFVEYDFENGLNGNDNQLMVLWQKHIMWS